MCNKKEVNESKIYFLSRKFIQDPFPVYSSLRDNDPVHRFLLPNGAFAWLITRFQDASTLLKDPRLVTNYPVELDVKGELAPHQEIVARNLLSVNANDHRRLRRLIQKAFTPRMIGNLRGRIEEIACELLDKVQSREKREINLIEDYAFPLPIIVICEMLGVPLKDQDDFREWSNLIMEGFSNPELSKQTENAMISFVNYLKKLIAERRNDLKTDLISDLLRVEDEGDVLSEQELYALVFVLIIAGHETTVNLIGNGILALLENPEQKEKLLNQPQLIHSTIEEILRYNGPAEVSNARFATEDLVVAGKHIKKGEMVFIALSSANRDSKEFIEPDSFDITREANNHLAFGKGVHFCLGAPLARLEGELAISALLERLPNLKLSTEKDSIEWRPGIIIRGTKEIPLTF